jgi:hypothetical protein
MATTKKPSRSTGKKSPAKAKKTVRQTKSPAAKPIKSKPPAIKAAVKSAPPRPRVMVVPPSEPLFRKAELDGAEPKKPVVKPAPVRMPRPPAKLPIPQSTYFF